jgi:NAD(P)-dependent dehydrogenase (short-subunit alcohol dehydrogenase family)
MIIDIAVTGANSGLGEAICRAMYKWEDNDYNVIAVNGPDAEFGSFTLPAQSADAAEYIKSASRGKYRILVNAAGINYIEWFMEAEAEKWDDLMDLNAMTLWKLPRALMRGEYSWFNGSGTVVNIVSNAAHVAMTNSVFYNASKAAAHMITLAMARELFKTHGLRVFGIAPNKLAGTGMSKYIEERVPGLRGWTPEQAAQYQAAALPTGEETDPEILAEFIAFLLSKPERHKYLSGTVVPYGG